ncbi:MAG: two-component system response regulator TorR [Magnetococcales bacterium]|nr:two-component system response regulator TorR [Magnetococcales bacterium]NGZ07528.1 two-component system response regulator TorR [Magnetococcales bacterium]
MSENQHILIVEDDPVARSLLVAYFEKEGYRISTAENGSQMWERLENERTDLVLLDINLPGEDGFSLTRALRLRSDIGIILVTARKEDMDRIIGLELGADDYVSKPFNERELLIRVRNLLRRTSRQRADEEMPVTRYTFKGWSLDTERRRLTTPDGGLVPLTNGEYLLLVAFVRKPGRVLTRDQLLEAVSSRDWMPNDRTIDVMVNRLRRKLGESAQPRLLVTVHGVGYRFLPDGE